MKKAVFLLYAFLSTSHAFSQEGFIDDGNSGCKIFTYKTENRHSTWIGECINGYAEGSGTLKVFEDDTLLYTYVGSVSKGKSEGQGTYTWTNGYKYVGQLNNSNREGQGTFTHPDGMEYVGQWKDNKKEGQGTVTWPDGKKYVGQWKDDKFEGEGTFTWPDGMEYVGQWKDNKYEGEGMLTWADGRIYVGQLKENKYDGKGIMYSSDGRIEKDGYWSENIFLGTKLTEEQQQAIKSIANRKKIAGQACKVKLKKEEFDIINGTHGYFYYYHLKASIINEDFIIVKVSSESACGTKISYNLYRIEITGSKRFIHTFETREEAFGKMIKYCGCDTWVNE